METDTVRTNDQNITDLDSTPNEDVPNPQPMVTSDAAQNAEPKPKPSVSNIVFSAAMCCGPDSAGARPIQPGEAVEYNVGHAGSYAAAHLMFGDDATGQSRGYLPLELRFPDMFMETQAPHRVRMPLEETLAQAQRGLDSALAALGEADRAIYLKAKSSELLTLVPSGEIQLVTLEDGRLELHKSDDPRQAWAFVKERGLCPPGLPEPAFDERGLTYQEVIAYAHVPNPNAFMSRCKDWLDDSWAEVLAGLRAGEFGPADVIASGCNSMSMEGRDRAGECRAYHRLVSEGIEPAMASVLTQIITSLHRHARDGHADLARDAGAWADTLLQVMRDPKRHDTLWNTNVLSAETLGIHELPYEHDHPYWRQARAIIAALDSGDAGAVGEAVDAFQEQVHPSGDPWGARPAEPDNPDAPIDWLLTREWSSVRSHRRPGPDEPYGKSVFNLPKSLWFPEMIDNRTPDEDSRLTTRQLEGILADAQRGIDMGLTELDEPTRKRYLLSRARLRIPVDGDQALRLVTLEEGRLSIADTEDAAETLATCRRFHLLPENGQCKPGAEPRSGQEVLAYCHVVSSPYRYGDRLDGEIARRWAPVAELLRAGKINAVDVYATRGDTDAMDGRDRAQESLAFHVLTHGGEQGTFGRGAIGGPRVEVGSASSTAKQDAAGEDVAARGKRAKASGISPMVVRGPVAESSRVESAAVGWFDALKVVESIVALHRHAGDEPTTYDLVEEARTWAPLILGIREKSEASETLRWDVRWTADYLDEYRDIPDGPGAWGGDSRIGLPARNEEGGTGERVGGETAPGRRPEADAPIRGEQPLIPTRFAPLARIVLEALASGNAAAVEKALRDFSANDGLICLGWDVVSPIGEQDENEGPGEAGRGETDKVGPENP